MLLNKCWQYATIRAIEEPIFNSTLERFYKLGIDGFIRESIQNSLDGKLPNSSLPVKVIIKTGEIESSIIPGIDDIKEHITSLKGGNDYSRESINNMKNKIHQTSVKYLTFEDQNTKGLTGAKKGENFGSHDSWGVYAYKKGVHFEETDKEVEQNRGGSHGIGKIAANAASDLNLMFFANCDENGEQHIGGTIQLIEHEIDNICYRSTGYFSDIDEYDKLIPFENHLSSIFEKKTRGLKIIVPFLRESYYDHNQIIRSVCDNFFLAILKGNLVVEVNDVILDKDNIVSIVNNSIYYQEINENELNKNFTRLYLNTYLNCQPIEVCINDKTKEYQFNLYLSYDETIKKGRIAIIRNIGMKIEDKKITGHASSPINGVLIPKTSREDLFLKSLENEAHNELSCEHIKNPSIQSNAKRFINNISKVIQQKIYELLITNNPVDGKIDTSELLYSVEKNFTRDLKKHTSSVKLTKGNKESKKIIVKTTTSGRKNKKKKDKKRKDKSIGDIIRDVIHRDGKESEKRRVRYLMNPDTVKRLVLKDKELLCFDFSDNDTYEGETSCYISMVVVDGDGKENEKEFNIQSNYSSIIDKNTNKNCFVENNIIKNVSIQNNKINLELKLSNEFNNALKFVYYVEV